MTQIFISQFFIFTHEQMFEEKLAILCDQKRQLIEDKDDKMVISAFFQIQNEFILLPF